MILWKPLSLFYRKILMFRSSPVNGTVKYPWRKKTILAVTKQLKLTIFMELWMCEIFHWNSIFFVCVNPYYDQILSDFVLFTEKRECWIYLVKNLKMLKLYLVAVILMTDFSCGMEIDSSNDMRSKVSLQSAEIILDHPYMKQRGLSLTKLQWRPWGLRGILGVRAYTKLLKNHS